MLAIKYPEDSATLRYNAAPLSDYDCTSNLNLMKKLLNRKGLQLNLNIHTVLASKNNFELARWLRTLIDPPPEQTAANYARESVQSHRELPMMRSPEQTPKKTEEKGEKGEKGEKKMESAERKKEGRGSLSKVKRLSMAKSEAAFFKDKKALRTELKIPINRRDKKTEEGNPRFYDTQVISNTNEVNEFDDMNDVLYERALEESIESLSRILEKVRVAASSEGVSLGEYKKAIQRAIFTK
jgi:hypothetical protein